MAYHVPTDTPSPWPRIKATAHRLMASDPALAFHAAVAQALADEPQEVAADQEEPSTIYYRRLTLLEWQALELRHTQNGVTDYEATSRDIALTCVVGWANYRDPVTDADIDFDRLSHEERQRDILALPQAVLTAVVARTHEVRGELERAKKNCSAG